MNYEYLNGKMKDDTFTYLEINSKGEKSTYNHNWVKDNVQGNEFLEICDEYYNCYEYYDIIGKNVAYVTEGIDEEYPIQVYNEWK